MINNNTQSTLSSPDELEYLLRILKDKFSGEEPKPREEIEPQPAKEQQPKRLARVRRKTVMPKTNNNNVDESNASPNKFDISPEQQSMNTSVCAGGQSSSMNGSFEANFNNLLNQSSNKLESRSSLYINKLIKVEDTEQLILSLFSVAENLVQDYKLADHKLRKECLKNRQLEHQVYEQECELEKLKHQNDEQMEIMMQFDQDYVKQKEDYQGLLAEIDELKRENKDLRDLVRGFNQEKQDIREAMQEKLDFQKEQQQKVNQTLITFKDKIKNLNEEITMLKKKIADLDRENQNLNKIVIEQKHQNKLYKDELSHLHHVEDQLKQRQAELIVHALPKVSPNHLAVQPLHKESIVSSQNSVNTPIQIKVEQLETKRKSLMNKTRTIKNTYEDDLYLQDIDNHKKTQTFENEARRSMKKVRIQQSRNDSREEIEEFLQQSNSSFLKIEDKKTYQPRFSEAVTTNHYLNLENQYSSKTLANELELDVFEDFFSHNDERSCMYFQEDDASELSPHYSPMERRMSMREFLAPFSPRNHSVSNGSSSNRKRLVARVQKGYASKKLLDPEQIKKLQQYHVSKQKRRIQQTLRNAEKTKQIKLSQREFADYLQKKYGNKKGLNKYDNILDKKINLGDLKRRQTLRAEAMNTQNTSGLAQQSDASFKTRELNDTLSPLSKQTFNGKTQNSSHSEEDNLMKLEKIKKDAIAHHHQHHHTQFTGQTLNTSHHHHHTVNHKIVIKRQDPNKTQQDIQVETQQITTVNHSDVAHDNSNNQTLNSTGVVEVSETKQGQGECTIF